MTEELSEMSPEEFAGVYMDPEEKSFVARDYSSEFTATLADLVSRDLLRVSHYMVYNIPLVVYSGDTCNHDRIISISGYEVNPTFGPVIMFKWSSGSLSSLDACEISKIKCAAKDGAITEAMPFLGGGSE